MGFVSESQIEEIRQRSPLEELLPEYNIHLVPAGRRLKALCPFHREKTPSFTVDREKQLYFCHGCQTGGDVFAFVRAMDGLEFREAVELLARRAGVVLQESFEPGGRRGRMLELYDALELAAKRYHELLLDDPRAEPARQYLRSRRIDESMWRRFRLGYSLPEWDDLLRLAESRGISGGTLEAAGLARGRRSGLPESSGGHSGYYDYFHGRLMFPITDLQGRPIGFGARTLGDDNPKYLNTQQTPLFEKSQVLYGLAQAKAAIRKEQRIAIVEGYTDAIMAHQAGLETFVASLGTAFTEENARQLFRLAPRVALVFDGDAAGQRASERSLDLLVTQDLDVWVHTITEGKDPCDAILALGGDEFQRRLESRAVDLFEFKWRCTAGSEEAASSESARARQLDEFLRFVGRISNIVTRKLVIKRFSERIGIDETSLWRRMQGVLRAEPASLARPRSGVSESAESPAASQRPGELAEIVLQCMLGLPERARAIWESVPHELFEGGVGRSLVEGIDRQLASGSFSGVGLQRALQDTAASQLVIRLLSGLEPEEGSPTVDFDNLWHNCQRDIHRWTIQRQVAQLEDEMGQARRDGDAERLRAARLERSRCLKALKGAARGGGDRVSTGSLV